MARKKSTSPNLVNPPIRVSTFTQQMGDAICERLAEGESLNAVCRDPRMPNKSTVFRWIRLFPAFADMYALACEARADIYADEIVDIADTPQLGETVTMKPYGREIRTGDMIEHRKLRIDARKWTAAKLRPKKYGERVDLTHASPSGGAVQVAVAATVSLDQAADAYRKMLEG